MAAIALCFHTLVAGFVDGAMASPPLLDLFGNIICSSQGPTKALEIPGQPGNRSHLPACCVVGCSIAGGHAAPASVPPFLPVLFGQRLDLPAPAYRAPVHRPQRSPLNPRAPPAAI
ncbi:MAG: hypothetical protein KDJ88_14155 [Bauldia sp.]|nr:hypothetical protein [Bauldia sp.]